MLSVQMQNELNENFRDEKLRATNLGSWRKGTRLGSHAVAQGFAQGVLRERSV